jgi:RNA polymerase sigma factor (sigma-70 family)
VAIARLLRWLIGIGRSREDAEDLIQEAFLRLQEHIGQGCGVVNEERFLKRTVENLSIDDYRAAQRHPHVNMTTEELEENLQTRDSGTRLDDALHSERRLEKVMEVLDAVDVRMRQIFVAHRAGHTHKEIAAEFAISRSSVGKQIARALFVITDAGVKE